MTEPVLGLQQLDAQLNPNALQLEVEGLDFPWTGKKPWVGRERAGLGLLRG